MTEPSLTAFLLARIAEDEAQARELIPGRVDPENARWHTESLAMASLDDRQRRYVAKWAPPRVLAECEAKRRIVDRYRAQLDRERDPDESQLAAGICVNEYENWILPVLALPYVDHDDFRDEWRP
jgi:hypothetical protein